METTSKKEGIPTGPKKKKRYNPPHRHLLFGGLSTGQKKRLAEYRKSIDK